MQLVQGVFPIQPTIFDDRGVVDWDGMRQVTEYIIASGAAGIVFPGLASEYDCLTPEERIMGTEKLGLWIDGRIEFIVGASAQSPSEASTFAKKGAQAGASVAMIMTPHAYDGDQEAMIQFFEEVSHTTGIDIMLQNAPRPMGLGLELEMIGNIAKRVDAVRFVKEETAPSGQRITLLQALAGDAIETIIGGAGGRYVIDELNRGASGTMPACDITEVHVAMIKHHAEGNIDAARDLFERSLPLLNMQTNFRWRLTKEVLKRRNLIKSTFTRAKGPELDAQDMTELDALLHRMQDIVSIP